MLCCGYYNDCRFLVTRFQYFLDHFKDRVLFLNPRDEKKIEPKWFIYKNWINHIIQSIKVQSTASDASYWTKHDFTKTLSKAKSWNQSQIVWQFCTSTINLFERVQQSATECSFCVVGHSDHKTKIINCWESIIKSSEILWIYGLTINWDIGSVNK